MDLFLFYGKWIFPFLDQCMMDKSCMGCKSLVNFYQSKITTEKFPGFIKIISLSSTTEMGTKSSVDIGAEM